MAGGAEAGVKASPTGVPRVWNILGLAGPSLLLCLSPPRLSELEPQLSLCLSIRQRQRECERALSPRSQGQGLEVSHWQ